MRLLVVEDEEGLARAVRYGLEKAGYAVDVATTVRKAVEQLAVAAYDVVLLDLTLPDGDGVDLCRSLREGRLPTAQEDGRDVRVLMLTARGELHSRVEGLDAGADDYLAKPFAMPELLARVRALLRREVSGGTAQLALGPLSLDTATRAVRHGERPLRLTNKEWGVLEYLLRRPGHVVSSEELLEHVWDANADPFTETVRVTVGTLRRKLAEAGTSPGVETVVGRGYRLRELP